MKTIKLLLLSFILISPTLYSQTKYIGLIDSILSAHQTKLLISPSINNIIPKNNIGSKVENNYVKYLRKKILKEQLSKITHLDSTTVVDSIIINKKNDDDIKMSYTYNSNMNELMELAESWDGAKWTKESQVITTYNSDGNIFSRYYEEWDNAQWTNDQRDTYTYNSDGNLVKYFTEQWDGTKWVNVFYGTHIYNLVGKTILSIHEEWNGTEWMKYWWENLTYNLDGDLISLLIDIWNGNEWVKNLSYTFFYNLDGNRTSYLCERWDGTKWREDFRYTFTYNSDENMISSLNEYWNGIKWINGSRDTYSYDLDGNVTMQLDENWNNGSSWTNSWRRTFTYNTNGNMILGLSESWDENQWVLADHYLLFKDFFGRLFFAWGSQINVYYSNITDIVEDNLDILSYSLSQNYPNPFNPTTTIKYTIPFQNETISLTKNVTLKVYDILGKEITMLVNEKKEPGNHQVKFNGNDLSSGVYFYRLQAGAFTETKKLLLMK